MSTDLVSLRPAPPIRRPGLRRRALWALERVPRTARRFPAACRREGRYTARGTAAAYRTWHGWCQVADTAKRLDAAERHIEANALALETQRRNRRKLTVATALALVAGMVWLAGATSPSVVAALLILAVGVLDAVGRHVGDNLGLQKGRDTPFREGESLRSVVANVKEYVEDVGAKVKVTGAEYDGGDGVALSLRHDGTLDQQFVEGLERWMRTYRGAILAVEDPTARGGSRVTVAWRDRLAVSVPPPMLAPDSRRGAMPAVVGVSADGTPTLIDRWRTHTLAVGQPGSGKSSGAWVLLDNDTANPDIRVCGIDLRGGGGPLLNAWGDLVEDMATSVSAAEKLLDRMLDEAKSRTTMLGARSRPGARNPGPENWTPADGQQWMLYIEELPLIAEEKALVSRYAELLRIGRAPAVCSTAISQDMSKETVGSTTFRKHVMTTVLFSCSAEDVTNLMGRGSLAAGWRADLLHPADALSPHDAGRCYIRSPRYPFPMQHRFFRFGDAAQDIHPRVRARLAARGTPMQEPGAGDDHVLDAEVVDAVDAAIAEVFRTRAAAWLPTQTILDDLATYGHLMDPRELRKRMPAPPARGEYEGQRVRGYSRP